MCIRDRVGFFGQNHGQAVAQSRQGRPESTQPTARNDHIGAEFPVCGSPVSPRKCGLGGGWYQQGTGDQDSPATGYDFNEISSLHSFKISEGTLPRYRKCEFYKVYHPGF